MCCGLPAAFEQSKTAKEGSTKKALRLWIAGRVESVSYTHLGGRYDGNFPVLYQPAGKAHHHAAQTGDNPAHLVKFVSICL